ncbi:hypothetical protein [Paraliomyxa miuraensis]|uniref:hypothetical protein n=1 Tax=Paraliomyxa miuraensis TaxID=376150 RepID=UPI00224FEDF5|nr:hypothetical protein [Paraliomyxa miuraensis]MCX4243704.1 hypothetical protein [Paraliomyxa miuraensis]
MRGPLLLGLVAFAIGCWLLVGESPARTERASELRARLAGTAAGAPEPEELREIWSIEPARAHEHEALLDTDAVSIIDAVTDGNWAYVELLADLEDLSFVSDERLECADRYAAEIEGACSYRVEMVLDRVDERRGRIVHVRTVLREHSVLDPEERSDAHCPDYVMCIGGIRLGQTVRIPEGPDRLAIGQELYSPWVAASLFDVDRVERLKATLERDVVKRGDPPHFESALDAANYWHAVNLARYLEVHRQRLLAERGEEGDEEEEEGR